MKFLHIADVHLGCVPDGGREWSKMRSRELWETFRDTIEDARKMHAGLVLIAGDLFHHTPDVSELREVNYLFGSYPELCFAIIAGNHDCNSPGSAWNDFLFSDNVAFLGNSKMECVRFRSLGCEVYGFSYDRQRIPEERLRGLVPGNNEYFHILLAHGGDKLHVPFDAASLESSPFDYIALGHIHKPSVVVKNKALFSGALSPIDSGDEGPHGYLVVETFGRSARVKFVKKALREYISLNISAEESDTMFSMRDKVEAAISSRGRQNLYHITICGKRSPSVKFDRDLILKAGMVLDVADQSSPAFCLEELKERYRDQLIGQYIESFERHERSPMEEKALQYGLEALLLGQR